MKLKAPGSPGSTSSAGSESSVSTASSGSSQSSWRIKNAEIWTFELVQDSPGQVPRWENRQLLATPGADLTRRSDQPKVQWSFPAAIDLG